MNIIKTKILRDLIKYPKIISPWISHVSSTSNDDVAIRHTQMRYIKRTDHTKEETQMAETQQPLATYLPVAQ